MDSDDHDDDTDDNHDDNDDNDDWRVSRPTRRTVDRRERPAPTGWARLATSLPLEETPLTPPISLSHLWQLG